MLEILPFLFVMAVFSRYLAVSWLFMASLFYVFGVSGLLLAIFCIVERRIYYPSLSSSSSLHHSITSQSSLNLTMTFTVRSEGRLLSILTNVAAVQISVEVSPSSISITDRTQTISVALVTNDLCSITLR